MAAVQFFFPFDIMVKPGNLGTPGGKLYFYQSGTTTIAEIWADSGLSVPLENPVDCDGAGRIPAVFLDNTATYRLYALDKNNALLVDRDPYIPGEAPDSASLAPYQAAAAASAVAASASQTAASASQTAAAASAVSAASHDASAGLSAAAAASSAAAAAAGGDPTLIEHLAVNPHWYGIIEGDDPAHGAANSTAMATMLAAIAASKRFRVTFPAGTYWIGDNGAGAGIDINQGNLIIEGPAGGGTSDSNHPLTATLKFPAGVTGIRIQGPQTSGANTKDGAEHSSGLGSVVRSLVLQGSFTTTEAEAHAIDLRTAATVEDVTARNFQGDGVHIAADGSAASGATPAFGNANRCSITRFSAYNCRNGIFFDGQDANACTVEMIDANACRQWGIFDSSGLGNTFLGGQLAGNGSTAWNDGVTGPAATVSYSGNRYGAIVGQEVWCSTHAPSGTTANNQGWYYIGAGGATTGIPAWFNGISVRAGGSVHDDSTAGRSYYAGIYAEGGYGYAQVTYPSLIVGGELADLVFQNPATATTQTAVIRTAGYGPTSSGSAFHVEPALQVLSGHVYANLGEPQGNPSHVGLNLIDIDYASAGFQFQFEAALAGDLNLTYGVGAARVFWITGPGTGLQFGTGVNVPYGFAPVRLFVTGVSEDPTNARRIMVQSGAPAGGTHARGEFAFNYDALAGQPFGWNCTAAGTPGTWQALWGLTAAPAAIATSGSGADLAAASVPYSKIQNVTAARLLGNPTGGAAAPSEISLAGGLAFSGTTLTAAGALTPTSVASTGNVTSSGGGVGYATGAGGAVTQATSKSTGVTLNKVSGQITMNSAALAAAAVVSFAVTNSQVAATDTINLNLQSGNATAGTYRYWIDKVSAGSFVVAVENRSAGSLSEALVFNFAVLKAVAA